jgi:ADP-ribose pyrophosphatase YjhB (NUDIX family)
MNEQAITDAFRKLYKARQDWFNASEHMSICRRELERERAVRIQTGEIFGKNEAERDARARELFPSLFAALEDAEQRDRQARLAYDLAKIEVERLDFLLRHAALQKA